jgi:hypothetical protein
MACVAQAMCGVATVGAGGLRIKRCARQLRHEGPDAARSGQVSGVDGSNGCRSVTGREDQQQLNGCAARDAAFMQTRQDGRCCDAARHASERCCLHAALDAAVRANRGGMMAHRVFILQR